MSGTFLWDRMACRDRHLDSPVYGVPESVRNYPTGLQRGMKAAVRDLARLATERPSLLQKGKLFAARPAVR